MSRSYKVTRFHCAKDELAYTILAYASDTVHSEKWKTSKDLYQSILSKCRVMLNKYTTESSVTYVILKVLKMIREECSRVLRGNPELEANTTNLLFAQAEVEVETVPRDDLRDFLIEALDIFSNDMKESESLTKENVVPHVSDDDVIMVYGYSELVLAALGLAFTKKKFSVVVLISFTNKGAIMVDKLSRMGIHVIMTPDRCHCTMMTKKIDKVFIECEKVFSDGAVLTSPGVLDICWSAQYYNIPVYVFTAIWNLSPCHSYEHESVLAENATKDDIVAYVNDVVDAEFVSMIISNIGSMEPLQMIPLARDSFCPEDVERLFSVAI